VLRTPHFLLTLLESSGRNPFSQNDLVASRLRTVRASRRVVENVSHGSPDEVSQRWLHVVPSKHAEVRFPEGDRQFPFNQLAKLAGLHFCLSD
jgi:hypothetical protein